MKSSSELNDRTLAIPLQLRAILPCRRLTVGDVLALEAGAILPTGRAAGDNVDVHISDQSIAQAELIVTNNTLAVRISEFTENT
jgi:flagellar motor switch/type III secretory pathway protein FliN